ncbi:MAG: response regulator [Candidatus Omnitrophota bacterium]
MGILRLMPKKKIFIADDQEEVLSMLKDFLSSKGYEVMGSKESRELVKSIKKFQPDLILLDLLMPDLDGFEICRILNSDPEAQAIPIIIMSGLSDLVDIQRAYKLGVVGYLTKPFDMNLVVAEIEKAIANKERPH